MVDKKHNFTKTEIKAGLLVIASIVVFALFVAAVTGLRPPKPMKTFYSDFVNLKGLSAGADVMFGGMMVGRVTEIGLLKDHPSLIRVTFVVNENVPINEESRATIAQTTLTAENHLELTTGSDRAALVANGAIVPSQEGGIFDVAGLVAQDVRELLGDIRNLLGVKERSKEELVTIEDLFTNVQEAVDEGTGAVKDVRSIVADNRDDIDAIVKKVQDIEDSADKLVKDINAVVTENRPGINASVENVRQATERVKAATDRLDGLASRLQAALDNAHKASGDTAELIEKARPVIEEMILDLRETVWSLKGFARTIDEQPESVLRGTTPQGRKR